MKHCPKHGDTPDWCYCATHNNFHTGRPCVFCEADRPTFDQPGDLRDLLNILEARIADQDTAILLLRRRITELEHSRLDRLNAINAQAAAIEAMENGCARAINAQAKDLAALEDRIEQAARLLVRVAIE